MGSDTENDVVTRRQKTTRGPKLHRLSVDAYPGRGLIKLGRECSTEEWVQLPAVPQHGEANHTWVSGPKFPKMDECAHFHYDAVSLSTDFKISVRTEYADHEQQLGKDEKSVTVYYIHVQCKGSSWTITRRYSDVATFDIQLHRCIFDRRYSMLPALTKEEDIPDQFSSPSEQLSHYFDRFTELVRETIHVKCGSVLNWMEMDNKGNHFLWHVNSGINVPAIAVATVTRNYVRREDDELELRIGDLVSIIDMPQLIESPWWRGKHSNKVGFFPSTCVEVIPGSVHEHQNITKQSSRSLLKHEVVPAVENTDVKKNKRLKNRLAVLFASRPDRDALRQQGILRARVFGAHLSEHLYDTDTMVPLVVRVCCLAVEQVGTINGVYRLSGVASNVQRLRQEFDSDNPPEEITDERYLNDVHCIASLCKMYFRELPDPLLTFQLYDQFAEAVSHQEVHQKKQAIKCVVRQLPPYHYSTLSYLMQHLKTVASQSNNTGMHSRNLALVWAPNLLKPMASESDASAFTEIKIQSVVLQFLIDNAYDIFSDNEAKMLSSNMNTPNSVRGSVLSESSANDMPLDSISQTSSMVMVTAAGQGVLNHRRMSLRSRPDSTTATADIIRSRTTSDLSTSISTQSPTRYQYRMKIPLMDLDEAQRAHAVSDTEAPRINISRQGFFRKKDNKKKKLSIARHSDISNHSSSNWARSIFNRFATIRRTQSLHHGRPTISGPCGFVADPYSTVLDSAHHITPGVGVENSTVISDQQCNGSTVSKPSDCTHDILSCCSKQSSNNNIQSNILFLSSVKDNIDKQDFVNEWCTDSIRQFLEGKPLSSIQPQQNIPPEPAPSDDSPPRCELRRSKSLPQKRRNNASQSEGIANVLRELQSVPSGDQFTEQVRQRFNTMLCTRSIHRYKTETVQITKRASTDLSERPAKHARPLSYPCYPYEVISPIRKSRSLRCSNNRVSFINTRSMSVNLTSPSLVV